MRRASITESGKDMEYKRELIISMNEKIKEILTLLQAEQVKKPLRIAREFGYLVYVRLFVESQKRESLQAYFPYAGFPMEWPGEDELDVQARAWQLQYQIQYCSSIVEEGHFMEQAQSAENAKWISELCKLIDWMSEFCGWEEGIPKLYGYALEEMVRQIYEMDAEGFFLLPETIGQLLLQMTTDSDQCSLWNPASRTGSFLMMAHKNHRNWKLAGSETDKEQYLLARMQMFFGGAKQAVISSKDPLEEQKDEKYQLIFSNPPVEEVAPDKQDRFAVATRKKQLQYLQMIMKRLEKGGQAVVIVNESTLFKFDAEMRVRMQLVEEYALLGVISLPADAFLPYTGSKASVLIFANSPEKVSDNSCVWFYELHDPGYTLDRKRQETNGEDMEKLLDSWRDRQALEVEWSRRTAKGGKVNQWENPVPEEWPEVHYWFADRRTIRKNDYNLTAGRYKPWKEDKTEEPESPSILLEQLLDLENETMQQIQELIEMTRKYG
jgi:type I restriction enzyme M protein